MSRKFVPGYFLLPAMLLMACQQQDASVQNGLPGETPSSAHQAETFISRSEDALAELLQKHERLAWSHSTNISDESETLAAEAMRAYSSLRMQLAMAATDHMQVSGLDAGTKRKLYILKQAINMPAAAGSGAAKELSSISFQLKGIFAQGTYCYQDGDCLDGRLLGDVMRKSHDAGLLRETWSGWRSIAPPMRELYARQVDLANEGAKVLGFRDLGAMWRSGYDMPEEDLSGQMQRIWGDVKPLYEALHCHTRAQLGKHYGFALVAPQGPIPAHLLGDMWAQDWRGIYPLLQSDSRLEVNDLDAILKTKGFDATRMVQTAEAFYLSLGFDALPETFWQRSQFIEPEDRQVNCQASAWTIDEKDDVRLKMCIRVNAEDFETIHHELGHNYYQLAYRNQGLLFRAGANDGFHEAVGDTVALSITPRYLNEIGLLETLPGTSADILWLLHRALERIAFLPFGLLVDQWRWQVFAGEVKPEDYNDVWWDLREHYQGVSAHGERLAGAFDPGAKYHVAMNVPYLRYFIARVLQFQFHRALCDLAGFDGPLHRCSIYGSKVAGERLRAMMEMGRSRPWQDALETLTGQRELDATALLEYFEPLKAWLDEQNAGQQCGW